MRRSVRTWLIVLPIIAVVIVIDQGTKRLVIDHLAVGESIQPIPALRAVFQITHSQNTGATFGLLPQAGDLFLVLAVIVTLAMLYFYPRIPPNAWMTRIGTGLVVGGALGNALDRLQHGPVTDFIHYQIPGTFFSNVSNLADHAIVLGTALLLIDGWLDIRREKRLQEAASEANPPVEHPTADHAAGNH